MKITIPSHLSDDQLVSEVMRFSTRARDATAQLVAHLAELDARRIYLGAGFSSLFAYCREVLRLSESETYNRIEAARAARRFPVILDMLWDGSVSLTSVRLLAPHLTDDNYRELLDAASGRSKREVEELVARRSPRPDVPSSIRKLPAAAPTSVTTPAIPTASTVSTPPVDSAPLPPAKVPPSGTHRPTVAPLAPDRYEVRFTASATVCEKLRLAKDLLRHAVPSGDTAEIVDRALTALLQDLARKKFAAVKTQPSPSRSLTAGSRHIPAEVKRAVWLRDGGRCAFVSKRKAGMPGRRCGEQGFLEFHHLRPYAAGGEATVSNIALRCRAHNAYESDLFYGPAKGGEGSTKEPSAHYGRRPGGQLVPGEAPG